MIKKLSTYKKLKEKNLKIKSSIYIGFFEIFFIVYCFIFHFSPTFKSLDGIYYYIQMISLLEDGDLYLLNNLMALPFKIDIAVNHWPIGTGLFWIPFYLIAQLLLQITLLLFPLITQYYPRNVLVFGVNIAAVNIGTITYAYLGLKILGISLKKYFKEDFSPILIHIAILLCTSLIFYLFVDPLMSHSISFFIICVLTYYWVKWHEVLNYKQIFWVFFILGIACLVRTQNLLYGIIFIPQISRTLKDWKAQQNFTEMLKNILKGILLAFIGFIIAFLPQIIAWWVQFDSIFPPWPISYFNFLNPRLDITWTSRRSGIFIWHPILIFFMFGLFLFYPQKRRNNMDSLVLFIAFFLQSYLWAIYNPGSEPCFGHRGLIDSYPLLSIGFYNLILSVNKYFKEKLTYLIFITLILIFSMFNLYLYMLLGPCSRLGYYSIYFPIGWILSKPFDIELFYCTFIPRLSVEKIVDIFSLIIIIIFLSSLIKFLEYNKVFIIFRKNFVKLKNLIYKLKMILKFNV